MAQHHITGQKGEALARQYLEEKGYEVLHTNWRHKRTELDIVARDSNVVVFVEVKARTGERYGYPEEAVGPAKEKHLQEAAEAYIFEHNIHTEVRFDIISITFSGDEPRIYHIEDAFFPYDG